LRFGEVKFKRKRGEVRRISHRGKKGSERRFHTEVHRDAQRFTEFILEGFCLEIPFR
jgi:hypothetical protein